MISKELEGTLNAALKEAKSRRHEYVCLEHLLYALLQDKDASSAIINCGGKHTQASERFGGVLSNPSGDASRGVGPPTPADPELSSRAAACGDPCSVGGKKGDQRWESINRDVSRAGFLRGFSSTGTRYHPLRSGEL